VPRPVKQPKHLFHFIIRYEGDGIVDENVADVIKAQINRKAEAEKADTDNQSKPQAPAYCVPPSSGTAPACPAAPAPGSTATPTDSQPKEPKGDKSAPSDGLIPSDPPPVGSGTPGDGEKVK
jgi:hypothetical protein